MSKEGVGRADVGRCTPAQGARLYFGGPNVFFVTVCAKVRVPWMTQETVLHSLAAIWHDEATGWLTGEFLIMPDHIHLFCAPHDVRHGIDAWIAYWKSCLSRRHLDKEWRFQRCAFHHRLRTNQEYGDTWAYVQENPVRAGLVKTSAEWPGQGCVHPIRCG